MKFPQGNFFVPQILRPIKTSSSNFIKALRERGQSLASPFWRHLSSEGAQFVLIIVLAMGLIVFKGGQPIFGSVVRQYTEETSAEIIPTDTPSSTADVNTLMATATSGLGGSSDKENDDPAPYTILDNSVEAVSAVSADYLNDYKANKIGSYTVQPGDVLSFIASDFGVSPETIMWANNLSSPTAIQVGQVLRIPPVSGVVHVVQRGDTATSLAKKYSANADEILSFNDLLPTESLTPGTELMIPGGSMYSARGPVSIAKNSIPASFVSSVINVAQKFAYLPDLGNYFKVPTVGFDWGIVHDRNGVDIANSCGTEVEAAADGTVTTAITGGWNGGFGNYVKISHPNGTETLYGHLKKLLVTEGQTVTQGEEIGLMGTTGHSTGCHLHFEVHGARNPLAKY